MKEFWNFLRKKIQQPFNKTNTENPILSPHMENLENRVRGAITFLKKNSIFSHGKQISLNSLPWFLLIGSPGAGKTTLLANSNIKFILDKKFKRDHLQNLAHSETCDWWVTANTVIIDIPGNYIAYKPKMASLHNKLWQHFLSLSKNLRSPQPINGIVIALSLAELLDKQQQNQLIESIRFRMQECQEKFGEDLPFYFAITKCDLMPGFVEFFSEYSSEELVQAWGVPLANADTGYPETFATRFNLLIKRLNNQLIGRLHQERSPHAKFYIKDFPLQLERFKEAFTETLKKLCENGLNLNLKGIYLTSAMQQPNHDHMTEQREIVLANQFQQALAIMHPPAMPVQAYFVKQFILHCLLPEIKNAEIAAFWQKAKVTHVLFGSMLVFSLVLFANNWYRHQTYKFTQQTLLTERSTKNLEQPKITALAQKNLLNGLVDVNFQIY